MRRTRRVVAPPVSIVICTYNRRSYLERLLQSLDQLRYPNYEVVVVNGPSTDGTAAMLERFTKTVRMGTCDEARIGRSRNIGVGLAAADIVALIDDDAIPGSDWLELLVARYEDERVAAVGGPVFDVPLDRLEWRLCTCTRLGVPVVDSPGPVDRYVRPRADPFLYFPGTNMSFRRAVWEEVGGFNELLYAVYEDAEFCSRVLDSGHRIAYAEDATVRHDRAPNSRRDETHDLKDPYALFHDQVVFALQCSSHSEGEVVDAANGHLHTWQSATRARVDAGSLSSHEYELWVERADAGVRDGIGDGRLGRPTVQIVERHPDLFRRFRRRGRPGRSG